MIMMMHLSPTALRCYGNGHVVLFEAVLTCKPAIPPNLSDKVALVQSLTVSERITLRTYGGVVIDIYLKGSRS